jgi:hypothetical protein
LPLGHERLFEIIAELVTRPGHEKTRTLIHALLVDGLDARSEDISYEVHLHRGEIRGRIDALLGRTVIEFKSDLRREKDDAEEELLRYLTEREDASGERYIAIATDGASFLTYERRSGSLVPLATFTPNPDRGESLVAWLDSVIAVLPELTPAPWLVRRELGRESVAFLRARGDLAQLWAASGADPSIHLKRELWAELLRRVYGSSVDQDSLWFQHTYLTIVAKTMATAILGVALPPAAELLAGEPFRDAQIVGAVESDFFDWVIEAGGSDLVDRLARQVARFRLGDVEQDVLKGLYESLIDPETRHELGEYYTPDWLAEKMVRRVVTAPLEQRVIDPAVGSGTFPFHAVRFAIAAAAAAGLDATATLRVVTDNVIGLDIHPTAVIIARVTYLLALGEGLLANPARPPVTVPIYLGDALQWNTEAFMTSRDVVLTVPDGGPELRFPFTVTENPTLFDEVVDAILEFSDAGAEPAAFRTWLERHGVTAAADVAQLESTFVGIRDLQAADRDHIWGYVARNLARPIWLSTTDQRADVVVGNPPWLSYRFMDAALRTTFREECQARNIWAGGQYATHQDLSAYFFARIAELYLKPDGVIALVMPHSALSRKQYAGFRDGRFGPTHGSVQFVEAWAFDERVEPLFPVPASVMIARPGEPAPLPDTITDYEGHLPRRDATLEEADAALTAATVPWPTAGAPGTGLYRAQFRQGATMTPRVLTEVEAAPAAGRFGAPAAMPVVQSLRSNLERRPWSTVATLRQPVEAAFVRPMYLGESIAPYRILSSSLAIVPWDGDNHELIDGTTALARGYLGVARWLTDAEHIWTDLGEGNMTLLERWDYHGELKAQFPVAELRLIYTTSGASPAAALLRDPIAIIDHKAYWAELPEDEARYLAAIVNSGIGLERARDFMSRGAFGTRDIHKAMLDLPFAEFDAENALHVELTGAAAEAEAAAAGATIDPALDFIRARQAIRRVLEENGIAARIDDLVTRLLAGA